MINIVAGSRIVPELWQYAVTPENIALLLEKMLRDKQLYYQIKQLLNNAKAQLGEPGASERASQKALEMMKC